MREGWLLINGQVATSLVVPSAQLVRFRRHIVPFAASCRPSRPSLVLGGVKLVCRRDGVVRRTSRHPYLHICRRDTVIVGNDLAQSIRKGDVVEVRMAQ